MTPSSVTELARPKINLSLHVTGKRQDGYHLLESLVVFAECGDIVTAEPAHGLSLSMDGPFGDGLGADGHNLVLRAAVLLQDASGTTEGAALHLIKNLPIASGIGGGSADAAAALRALNRLWRLDWPQVRLEELALSLGADVPVCIASRTRIMRGIGDRLSAGPALPDLWILLVNPMRGVETRAVFQARQNADFTQAGIIPARFIAAQALTDWLTTATTNDLAAPARQVQPVIAEVETALAALPGTLLTRMSGSGATCFALCATESAAEAAAETLRAAEPGWWCDVARVVG